MSDSVAEALYLTGGQEAYETAFSSRKLIDCLNVTSYNEGRRKRKPFLQVYRSPQDFRLTVSLLKLFIRFFSLAFLDLKQFLREEFLPYLKAWKESVKKREGHTAQERKMMIISQETLNGIHITGINMTLSLFNYLITFYVHAVSSFLELVPLILNLPGVSAFMSGKLNQDPLEKFFSCVRQVNDNPTIGEALKTTQTFRVISAIRFSDVIVNCRGSKKKSLEVEDTDHAPLIKRKYMHKRKHSF